MSEQDKPTTTIVLHEFPGFVLLEIDPVEQQLQIVHQSCGQVIGSFFGGNYSEAEVANLVQAHTCKLLPAKV